MPDLKYLSEYNRSLEEYRAHVQSFGGVTAAFIGMVISSLPATATGGAMCDICMSLPLSLFSRCALGFVAAIISSLICLLLGSILGILFHKAAKILFRRPSPRSL